jgi:hypothetical protein
MPITLRVQQRKMEKKEMTRKTTYIVQLRSFFPNSHGDRVARGRKGVCTEGKDIPGSVRQKKKSEGIIIWRTEKTRFF